jgi:hypothetical protein
VSPAEQGDDMSYFASRAHFKYYDRAYGFCAGLADAVSVLDVGCNEVPFVQRLAWIPDKHCLDLNPIEFDGVTSHTGDFLTHEFGRTFDLVLCMQVLEHVTHPVTFAAKLFSLANKHVLISVPYNWKRGLCKEHVHDPVDEAKLKLWTGRDPDHSEIVTDKGRKRLVCWYDKT